MKKNMVITIKFLYWFLIFYVAIMAFMYVFQRNFTFQPGHDNPFKKDHRPFDVFSYQTPMGLNLRGLFYPAQPGKPTIVYFQGNAGTLSDRLYKTEHYLKLGYGMALVGYRGYSGNPGQPTERNFYEDARSAIHAIEKFGIPQTNMVFYGESLGTGVATQMATEFKPKGLILEAPFTSAVDIGKRKYWFLPVSYLMKDKFDNASKIGSLTLPILIIHGTADHTVPYKYGVKLFSFVKSPVKQFITLDGAGHADVYDFKAGDHINAFLANL